MQPPGLPEYLFISTSEIIRIASRHTQKEDKNKISLECEPGPLLPISGSGLTPAVPWIWIRWQVHIERETFGSEAVSSRSIVSGLDGQQ